MAALKGMPDIEAASTSTVNAWKRLQINTASQLSKLLAAEGRAEEASKMDADAQVGCRSVLLQVGGQGLAQFGMQAIQRAMLPGGWHRRRSRTCGPKLRWS